MKQSNSDLIAVEVGLMHEPRHAKLVGKKVIPCSNMLEAAMAYEYSNNRVVAQDRLPDGMAVSTVFLFVNHNFDDAGNPEWFETMMFGDDTGMKGLDRQRYATYDDALNGHMELVRKYSEAVELSEEKPSWWRRLLSWFKRSKGTK